MDEHRVTGTAKNVGGKIEEGFGRVAGDMKSQVQGQAKQVQGAAEDLYGQAKDAAGGLTDVVRNTIETRPYTAVAVALASAGCSVGRTGRFRQSRSSGRASNLCVREDGNVPGCLLLRFSQPRSLRRSFRPAPQRRC